MTVGEIKKFLAEFPDQWAVEEMQLPNHRNVENFAVKDGMEMHHKIRITFSHTFRIENEKHFK